jgi:teichuronic acid exporter
MNTIKSKTIGGLKWSFIDNISNSGITFLVGLVLARLLSPTEFGIIGIITVFVAVSNTIIDGGLSVALIRRNDIENCDYNTVFILNFLISLILYASLCLISHQIAHFFNEPLLEKIIPIMALLLIINSLSIIQKTILVKKIDFKTQAKISLISSVSSGIIGISLAYNGFTIWSLVFQQLSRQLIATILLWVYSSWIPKLEFSKKSFKELFGFGSKILLANLVNTIYQNIFLTIIGKLYTSNELGKYSRAEQFNAIFTNNLSMVIQKVSFPALSEIQHNVELQTLYFKKSIIISSIITCFFVLGLAAIAKPLILILIGYKWIDSVLYLQIISLYGVLYPLSIINLNMLNIKGKSNLFLKLEIIKKILFIPVLCVGFFFKLKLMLMAAVIYYYIEFIANSFYSERYFDYGTIKQIKDLLPIYLISFIVSFIVWLISFFSINLYLMISCQMLLLLGLTYISYVIIKHKEFLELKQLVNSYIRKC